MPVPKIKKFSRSKITEQEPNEEFNEEYNEPIQPIVKVKKPRNKKVKAPIYEYGGDEPPEHQEPEPIIEDDFELPDVGPLEFDTDFLRELNNENYEKEDTVKETIQQPLTQSEQIINQLIRGKNTGKKQPKKQKEIKSLFEDDDSLFDEIGTECLGREKREMIAKINQYKNLFPDELKKSGMAAFTLDGNRVRRVSVEVNARNATQAWVTQGLKPAMTVIVYPSSAVKDGVSAHRRSP